VALGQATIGLATDTGGSIRVPSSYQGLWGIRTTHGAVDRTGLLPLSPSFDTVGWITRDPDTLLAAARASLNPGGQRDAPQSIAIVAGLLDDLSPEIRKAFDAVIARLISSGTFSDLTEVRIDDLADLQGAFRSVQAAEAWREHGAWIKKHPGALGDAIAERFAYASTITSDEETNARNDVAVARTRIMKLLNENVLVVPAAASVAPQTTATAASDEATRQATLRITCIAGISGAPATSAPLATVNGAPLGISFVGPRHTDLSLIEMASTAAGSLLGR
jgi:Asp-tRNA(Asn)/Glu-tRNA(Gln) amidotransferase A subunit family amidase